MSALKKPMAPDAKEKVSIGKGPAQTRGKPSSDTGMVAHGQVRVLLYLGKKLPKIRFTDKYLVYNRMDDLIHKGDKGDLKAPAFGLPEFNQIFSNGMAFFQGNRYQGHYFIIKKDGLWHFINEVDLETYLRGVLPFEMDPSWPLEALKAQAVASRSYVLYHMQKKQNSLYHLKSTVQHQVYRGLEGQNERTNQAVKETQGMVLTHGGKIIPAFFHSTSGGVTENGSAVWEKGDFSYTKIVRSNYGIHSPNFAWEFEMDSYMFLQFLQKKYDLEVITSFHIAKRSASGRAKIIRIVGKKGNQNFTKELNANQFRLVMGSRKIKSLLFSLEKKEHEGRSYVVFRGRGFGHGVGMDQWGAFEMAQLGKKSEEILDFYYNQVKIEKKAVKNYLVAGK